MLLVSHYVAHNDAGARGCGRTGIRRVDCIIAENDAAPQRRVGHAAAAEVEVGVVARENALVPAVCFREEVIR